MDGTREHFAAAKLGGDRRQERLIPFGPRGRGACLAGLVVSIRGVLYDSSGWRRWLLQLVSRMGLHTHYTCFFRVWDREFLPDVIEQRRDYWDAFRAFLRSAGLTEGQVGEVVAAAQPRRQHFQESIRPMPGVRATLLQLETLGIQLAATCGEHRSARELERELHSLGLADRFSVGIPGKGSDRDVDRAEDRFRTGAASMHLAAGEVAAVSSDALELAGARRAGLQTIAFNYDADAQADYYLDQFSQILQLPLTRSVRLLAS